MRLDNQGILLLPNLGLWLRIASWLRAAGVHSEANLIDPHSSRQDHENSWDQEDLWVSTLENRSRVQAAQAITSWFERHLLFSITLIYSWTASYCSYAIRAVISSKIVQLHPMHARHIPQEASCLMIPWHTCCGLRLALVVDTFIDWNFTYSEEMVTGKGSKFAQRQLCENTDHKTSSYTRLNLYKPSRTHTLGPVPSLLRRPVRDLYCIDWALNDGTT